MEPGGPGPTGRGGWGWGWGDRDWQKRLEVLDPG